MYNLILSYIKLTRSSGLARSIRLIDYILEKAGENIYNTLEAASILKGPNDNQP